MDQERGEVGPGVTDGRDPDEIRREIEGTREDLGETVEALAAKTDVKAQATDKVADVKSQAQAKVADLRQTVAAKKQAVTGQSDGAGAYSAGQAAVKAGEATARAQALARGNPTAVAALAALAAGFLLGRLTSR